MRKWGKEIILHTYRRIHLYLHTLSLLASSLTLFKKVFFEESFLFILKVERLAQLQRYFLFTS